MKANQKSVNPAVKSMASMAFYLVLLIGMWAILGHVMFPDKGAGDSYAELVPANEPLLAQIAENVIDPEQWTGIQQTAEVQDLLEKLNVAETRSEDGQAKFFIASENPTGNLATYISFFPDGDFQTTLTGGGWEVVELEGKSSRWENGANYIAATQLTEKFYLVETNTAK